MGGVREEGAMETTSRCILVERLMRSGDPRILASFFRCRCVDCFIASCCTMNLYLVPMRRRVEYGIGVWGLQTPYRTVSCHDVFFIIRMSFCLLI